MKITKQRLKEIIQEEVLEELEMGPFDRAREKVHNLVDRLGFEAKPGRAKTSMFWKSLALFLSG